MEGQREGEQRLLADSGENSTDVQDDSEEPVPLSLVLKRRMKETKETTDEKKIR